MNVRIAESTDPVAWDRFVGDHPCGHYMQSHAWGELQRAAGWTVRYCVASDDAGIRGAALVLSRRIPLTGASVHYSPRGPVVAPGDREALDALLAELSQHVKADGGVFLRFDPYWTEAEVATQGALAPQLVHVPRDWSSWNAPRFVFWLDLSGDEATLFKRLASGCRNEVKKGYKNGVEFTLGGEEHLGEFFKLMVLTGQQKGIAFHGLDYYSNLHRVANRSVRLQLFLGRLGEEVIAAGMSIIFGDKAWLLYAASAPAHYKLRANRTLQWEMIKWAHASGCRRYDFRGTATNDPPSPADPGYGVYEFKKSFGPEFTRMVGYLDLVRRPLLYRSLRFSEDRLLPTAYRIRTLLQR